MAAGTGKPAASTPTVQTYPTLPAPTQPTQATVIATTTPTEPKLPAGPVEYREIYWSYKQFLPQYSEYEGEYFILEFPEKMGELEAHLVNNLNCPEYRAKIILKEISEYDRYESGIMLITFWTEHYMHNAIDVSRQEDGSYLVVLEDYSKLYDRNHPLYPHYSENHYTGMSAIVIPDVTADVPIYIEIVDAKELPGPENG